MAGADEWWLERWRVVVREPVFTSRQPLCGRILAEPTKHDRGKDGMTKSRTGRIAVLEASIASHMPVRSSTKLQVVLCIIWRLLERKKSCYSATSRVCMVSLSVLALTERQGRMPWRRYLTCRLNGDRPLNSWAFCDT